MTTKTELLALARSLEDLAATLPPYNAEKLFKANDALREYAAMLDAEPVAWLAAYVNNVGLPDHYVTTHHELAVENDANRSPKPLFFHPPTTHEPMAWIDSMGHPHHLSAIQGVREKQLHGPWKPVYLGREK